MSPIITESAGIREAPLRSQRRMPPRAASDQSLAARQLFFTQSLYSSLCDFIVVTRRCPPSDEPAARGASLLLVVR